MFMSDFSKLADDTKLSPEELAHRLGISVSTLWRYRTGKTKRLDSGVVDRLRALHLEVTASPTSAA